MRINSRKEDPRKLGCHCDQCPLRNEWPILPRTPKVPKAVVVTEQPGYLETIKKSKHLSWDSEWTASAAKLAGYTLDDLYPVRTILCRPSRKLTSEERKLAVSCCQPQFQASLEAARKWTDRAVVLGATQHGHAMRVMTGHGLPKSWWGAPLTAIHGFTAIAAPHPTHIREQPQLMVFLAKCLHRAAEKMQPVVWPEPEIGESQRAWQLLRRMKDERCWVGVDVETRGKDPLQAPLICFSIAAEWGGVSLRHPLSSGFCDLVQDILRHNPVAMHNMQHDLLSLKHVGGYEVRCDFDTMLAHAVAHFEAPHDLGLVAAWYLFMRKWKTEYKAGEHKGDEKFFAMFQHDPISFQTYNYGDAWTTVCIRAHLQKDLERYYKGIEIFQGYMDSAQDAMQMREYGSKVSIQRIEEHKKDLLQKMARAKEQFDSIVRGTADLGKSGDTGSLYTLFFARFGLEPLKYTDTGEPSLDNAFLTEQRSHKNDQIRQCAELVLVYRRAYKLVSTYLRGVEQKVDAFGRIHPTFNVHGAITGRWSSKSPNFQNFPKSMRDIIVAGSGRKIVTADYSQLELRIMALLSGAEKLLQWYAEGKDIHTLNALEVYRELLEAEKRSAVTVDERTRSKSIAFGSLYGGDPKGLHSKLVASAPDLKVRDVARAQEILFATHPEIKQFQEKLLDEAKQNLYVEEQLSGRRRHFLGRVKPTEVLNFPIQGFAGELMRRAIRKIIHATENTDIHLINQVHDSAYLEGPASEVEAMRKILLDSMVQTITLNGHTMTFTIDVAVGDDMLNVEALK